MATLETISSQRSQGSAWLQAKEHLSSDGWKLLQGSFASHLSFDVLVQLPLRVLPKHRIIVPMNWK